MERKVAGSERKKRKPGILSRPVNPEFLKNAVSKTDGIEIRTNQPLGQLSQNSEKRGRLEKEPRSDREDPLVLVGNFTEGKRKPGNSGAMSPEKLVRNRESEAERSMEVKAGRIEQGNSPSRGNIGRAEYNELMGKVELIISVNWGMVID